MNASDVAKADAPKRVTDSSGPGTLARTLELLAFRPNDCKKPPPICNGSGPVRSAGKFHLKIIFSMPKQAIATSRPAQISRFPGRLVVCAGLKSSGSTWLYNIVAEILRRGGPPSRRRSTGILQFYADSVDAFPEKGERASDIVVKTHIPSRSLQFLTTFAAGHVLLTVRDPRDAIASVVQRFGHPFDGALEEISRGAECMVRFLRHYNPPVFRYERRFYDDPETVRVVCDLLRVRLPRAEIERIFAAYTRENVGRTIRKLQDKGVFGPKADPDQFDPRSHWHPGHVGDLVIGKYREVLSPKQQRATIAAMDEFFRTFGYSRKLPQSPRRRR